jgi:hypothetical protein
MPGEADTSGDAAGVAMPWRPEGGAAMTDVMISLLGFAPVKEAMR